MSFALLSFYVIESLSYIIKISDWVKGLFIFAMIPNKRKEKKNKKKQKFILILLIVMTSHRKSMMIKNCWELVNIALVIVAISRK